MTERSYQDAVQVLKDRLGGRWEGIEAEGRAEMSKILRDELGFDRRTADDAIEAMIESGTLRYHRLGDAGRDVVPAAGAGTTSGGPTAGGMAGIPIAAGLATNVGYWQIGPGETDAPGRAGQVTPS
jgi:hypothetical protein